MRLNRFPRLSKISFTLSLVALLSAGACKSSAKNYPDSTDGLKALASDIVNGSDDEAAAIAATLKPGNPDELYAKFFDADLAVALAAEIKPMLPKFDSLGKALKGNNARGRTEIIVEAFTDPKDDNMNAYQQAALEAMKNKVTLYSVRMVEPGKDSGNHLWSFAHVDGKFVFLGKMKAAAGAKGFGPMGELRVKSAKEIMSGKK